MSWTETCISGLPTSGLSLPPDASSDGAVVKQFKFLLSLFLLRSVMLGNTSFDLSLVTYVFVVVRFLPCCCLPDISYGISA